MIDMAWLQNVKDGRRVIAQLDYDIFNIPDQDERDIILGVFKEAKGMFDYSVSHGSETVPQRYYRLLEIANLVDELLDR